MSTWCDKLTHWKGPWFWERLKAGGEEDNGGWDGWMASPTGWTWVWGSPGSWWWTGRCCSPSGREESDTTEQLNWSEVMLTERNLLSLHPIRAHDQKINKRYLYLPMILSPFGSRKSRAFRAGHSLQFGILSFGIETILIGSLQNFLFVYFWLSRRPPNNSADEEKLTSVKAISKHRRLTHRTKYCKLRNNSVHHTFHWSGSHLIPLVICQWLMPVFKSVPEYSFCRVEFHLSPIAIILNKVSPSCLTLYNEIFTLTNTFSKNPGFYTLR